MFYIFKILLTSKQDLKLDVKLKRVFLFPHVPLRFRLLLFQNKCYLKFYFQF